MTTPEDAALALLAESLHASYPSCAHLPTLDAGYWECVLNAGSIAATSSGARLLAALRDGLAVATVQAGTVEMGFVWAPWGGRWQWLLRGPDGSSFGDTFAAALSGTTR